jgi:hypothetical protein
VTELDEMRFEITRLALAKTRGCDCAKSPESEIVSRPDGYLLGVSRRCSHGLGPADWTAAITPDDIETELRTYMLNGTTPAELRLAVVATAKAFNDKREADARAYAEERRRVQAEAEAARAEAQAFRSKVVKALRTISIQDVVQTDMVMVPPGKPDPNTKRGFLEWLGLP